MYVRGIPLIPQGVCTGYLSYLRVCIAQVYTSQGVNSPGLYLPGWVIPACHGPQGGLFPHVTVLRGGYARFIPPRGGYARFIPPRVGYSCLFMSQGGLFLPVYVPWWVIPVYTPRWVIPDLYSEVGFPLVYRPFITRFTVGFLFSRLIFPFRTVGIRAQEPGVAKLCRTVRIVFNIDE